MLEPTASTPLTRKLRAPNPKALVNEGRSSGVASRAIGSARVGDQLVRPVMAAAGVEGAGGIAGDPGPCGNIASHHGPGSHDGLLADSQSAEDDGPRSEGCAALHPRSLQLPVVRRAQLARFGGGPRKVVVDEDDAVAHEGSVADR